MVGLAAEREISKKSAAKDKRKMVGLAAERGISEKSAAKNGERDE